MQSRPFAILAVTALAACSSPREVAEKTGVTAHAAASASASSITAGAAGAAKSVKEDNDLYSFGFSYPAQVGAYPQLAAKLQAEADKAKADLVSEANEAQADAKKEGFPFNPHSWSEDWKVVADIPGFLSLTGENATYEGGAHGMYATTSLVWDKAAKVALDGAEMFRSADALEAALGKKLCAALDAERAKKRGADYQPAKEGADDLGFDSCQHVRDATVIVGSSNGRTFDRIGVWFGPYLAGPYAEGAYELNFPVDAAVLGAVKPAYRSAFSVKR
jgi:hypothetical protein